MQKRLDGDEGLQSSGARPLAPTLMNVQDDDRLMGHQDQKPNRSPAFTPKLLEPLLATSPSAETFTRAFGVKS
jgi:hypothetical protein